MKAPNGAATNLTEKQWLQMRTPAFKQWFGDWEMAAAAREIQDMEATPATVLPERMAQKDAEAIAGSFREMTNKRYGVTEIMPKGTVGKIFGHKGFNVTQIFDDVPMLFENSVLVLSEKSDGHKQRNNVNAYHHFVNKFKVDGKEYYIRFTVFELKARKPTNNRSIHSTAISEVEVYTANKKTSFLGRSGSIGPGVKGQTSFVDKKVSQVLDSVNNSSKVVDDNGEPLVVWHGTNSDFSVFDINMSGKNTNNKGIFGNGFYMTNLPRIAQNYQGKMRPDSHGRQEVDQVRRLGSVILDPETGNYVPVMLTVIEYRNDMGRKIYTVEAVDVVKYETNSAGQLADAAERGDQAPITEFAKRIANLAQSVNNASQVVDGNGEPLTVFHGTGQADSVGSVFRKDRATSGPMAFFTDACNIAEGCAEDKTDTSLSRERLNEDYRNHFTVEV